MTRLYAPDFCKATDMAYLIGMTPTQFREAVRNGFLPEPTKNPYTGVEIWDREEVVASIRSQQRDAEATPSEILMAARGG